MELESFIDVFHCFVELLRNVSIGRKRESRDELVQNWLVIFLEQVLDGLLLAYVGIFLLGLLVAVEAMGKSSILRAFGAALVSDSQGIFIDLQQLADDRMVFGRFWLCVIF